LLREVAAGGPADVAVLVATGSHDPAYYSRRLRGWIAAAAQGAGLAVRTIVNDCDDAGSHVFIGATKAGTPIELHRELLASEVRVYGHESKHHYMNGYSCIDKQAAPGMASRATIQASHKKALDHHHSIAGRNPWHRDEANRYNPFAIESRDCRLASESVWLDAKSGHLIPSRVPRFALDMISTSDAVLWAQAGDPDQATRDMICQADAMAAFEVERTRYVVVSPGGPPACNAVYGVQNCFDMALKGAIQDGGEALVLAPCAGEQGLPEHVKGLAPDEKSKELFWDNLVRFRDVPLAEAAGYIENHFELYLWKTDRVLKLLKESRVRVYLHSELPPATVAASGLIPVRDPQAWIHERAARGDGKLRAIDKGTTLLVRGR
jgi:nickel-dependent lactate racemase